MRLLNALPHRSADRSMCSGAVVSAPVRGEGLFVKVRVKVARKSVEASSLCASSESMLVSTGFGRSSNTMVHGTCWGCVYGVSRRGAVN